MNTQSSTSRTSQPDERTAPSKQRQFVAASLFLLAVTLTAVVGSVSSIANIDGWYQSVEKVAWNPPNAVFGPAWTVLYVLIAIVGFLLWKAGYRGQGRRNEAAPALGLYIVQLALNFAWTPVFFAGYPRLGEAAWGVALAIIVLLAVVLIWLIALTVKHSRIAAGLLVPYLAWIIFASTLNAGILVLN